ncbi:MAG: PilN domain-containing protein [Burkholderiales bacterium]
MSQQINLFNPQLLKQKKYFSAVTMTQALGLLVLGMAVFYGFALWQDRSLRRQTEESGRAYEQQKQLFAKVAAELNPEKREAQLDQDLKSTETAIAERQALLREIQAGVTGESAGYSQYLRAFARQTVPGLWLTSIQITEGASQLTMSGRALQADMVPLLIARLKRETLLRGRPLEALAITRGVPAKGPARSVVEFTVSSPGPAGAENASPDGQKAKR